MIGTAYVLKNEDCTILSYTQKGDVVKVKTSGRDYEKHVEQMPAFLAAFKPITSSTPVTTTLAVPTKLNKMQDALMMALQKVQAGGADLEEARTVSKLVQTGINLARLELEAIKVARA